MKLTAYICLITSLVIATFSGCSKSKKEQAEAFSGIYAVEQINTMMGYEKTEAELILSKDFTSTLNIRFTGEIEGIGTTAVADAFSGTGTWKVSGDGLAVATINAGSFTRRGTNKEIISFPVTASVNKEQNKVEMSEIAWKGGKLVLLILNQWTYIPK